MIDLRCHAPQMFFFYDYFVCYKDLSEYIGIEHIWQGFHGETALKKHY